MDFIKCSALVLFSYLLIISTSFEYNLCAKNNVITKGYCKQLRKDKCVLIPDSLNCVLKLQENTANFASFNAEQLYFITHFLNDTFVVIEEIRNVHKLNDDYEFQTIVLIRKNNTSTLKGKKYCHPGFDESLKWSKRVLTAFESYALKQERSYDEQLSFVENKIKTIAEYFGPSCRPGKWVENSQLNDELQDKYRNLFELCDGLNKEANPHYRTMECLTKNEGDIAYVDYDHAIKYFDKNKHINRNDYELLCKERGDRQNLPIIGQQPCTWVKQPLSTIISTNDKKKFATSIQHYLQNKEDTEGHQNNTINRILDINDNEQEYPISEIKSVSNYMWNYRDLMDLDPFDKNEHSVKWCLTSELELEKCNLLRAAAIALGIQPEIECIYTSGQNSLLDCFKNIQMSIADIVVSDSSYGFIARTYFNLNPIAYEKSNIAVPILAIIKENSTDTITSFNHLKNKNACFSLFQGIGWQAAYHVIKKYETLENDSLLSFFNSTCAPGQFELFQLEKNDSIDACSLCSDDITNFSELKCSKLPSIQQSNNQEALHCLNNVGDVTFIELKYVQDINNKNYRVICRNNTLANYPGFKVDKNCALATVINTEVLTKYSNLKNIDIKLLLLELEKNFNNNSMFQTMNAFTPFRNKRNIMFKDSTRGFYLIENQNEYFTDYNNLIQGQLGPERDGELSYGYYLLIFGSITIIIGMMGFVIYNVVVKSEYHRANRVEF